LGIANGAGAAWTPALPYPDWARSARIEGSVLVELWIDAHGVPRDAGLLAGSGSARLDAETLRLLKAQWRFEPAPEVARRRLSVRIEYALNSALGQHRLN